MAMRTLIATFRCEASLMCPITVSRGGGSGPAVVLSGETLV